MKIQREIFVCSKISMRRNCTHATRFKVKLFHIKAERAASPLPTPRLEIVDANILQSEYTRVHSGLELFHVEVKRLWRKSLVNIHRVTHSRK